MLNIALSDVASVVAVAAILGILPIVWSFYRQIRSPAWIWSLLAWGYALGVRTTIMILDLPIWPSFVLRDWTVLNALMSAVYVFIFISFLLIWLELKHIRNGRR